MELFIHKVKKNRVGSLKQSLTNSKLVISISALNIYMLKPLFTSSHSSVNEDHTEINIKCSKVNFVVLQKCGKGGIFQIHFLQKPLVSKRRKVRAESKFWKQRSCKMICSSIKVINLLHTLQKLLHSPSNSGNYSAESIPQTQRRWE